MTRTLGGVRGFPCQFLAGQSTRLNAVLYFRNLINNTTFKRKVRFHLSIFTQTWFFAQRLVSRNVFSTQSLSTKFGSDFTYHAKIFGKFFKNIKRKNRSEAFSVSSENILHLTSGALRRSGLNKPKISVFTKLSDTKQTLKFA